jgi:hypothetical protein
LGVSCTGLSGKNTLEPLPRSAGFVHDIHSQWFAIGRHEPGDRILHVIRDPRDIVISAMHYHRKSDEKWLHRPDDRFGGKTYQQMLNSLPDDKTRLMFEMDYSSGEIIRGMCAWPYGQPDCFETKYETLLCRGQDEFARVARHLGLTGDEVDVAVSAFLNNSLAGDARNKIGNRPHIRSGATEQWRAVFGDELIRAFLDRFPDALSRLGYKPSD